MRLFDIHYKGDRIVYELGLQEAIAHVCIRIASNNTSVWSSSRRASLLITPPPVPFPPSVRRERPRSVRNLSKQLSLPQL